MSIGIDAVRETAQQAKGRTIREISLEPNRSKTRLMHHDETLTLEFTDGTKLVLQIGSNAGACASDDPKFDARRWDLSFCASFTR